MRIQKQFKKNIDGYKNALLTHQLIKNPQQSYGEAAKNIYKKTFFYIR
jgi:hypothetical protein